jgi:hypothetical protein
MSESKQLVPTDVLGQQKSSDIAAMMSGGDSIPYFRLYGSNTDACKEGKIGIAHYGMESGGAIVDAGKEVPVVVLAMRPKAVQTGDDWVVDYHPDVDEKGRVTNPTFLRIMADSKIKNSGAMYGPEILLWVPSLDSFVTWHLNNPTARRAAREANIDSYLGKAATLSAQIIKNTKNTWHGPTISPHEAEVDLPPFDIIQEHIEKFLNPPRNQVETVSDTEERAR